MNGNPQSIKIICVNIFPSIQNQNSAQFDCATAETNKRHYLLLSVRTVRADFKLEIIITQKLNTNL